MTIDSVNKVLEFAGLLNDGANHGCAYEFVKLPAAATLGDALALHFGSLVDGRTKQPHRARDWHIGVVPMAGTARDALRSVVDRWVFATHCSPEVGPRRAWVRENVVSFVVGEILAVVGENPCVDEVHTRPPTWYEGTWQDVALSSAQAHWLLHFGISD